MSTPTKVTTHQSGGADQQSQPGLVCGRYNKMATTRSIFLNRGRDSAKFTIPMLVPPEGHSSATKYPTPYQSVGARGVNNLASKLLLVLFPLEQPFFKLDVDDATLQQFGALRGDVEEALASIERTVTLDIASSTTRIAVLEALKQLLVAGNVLLHFPDAGGASSFRLDRYVVKRDPMGNVLEIIIKEELSPRMLSESVRAACDVKIEDPKDGRDQVVAVYTYIERSKVSDRWDVVQEINGKTVPDSLGHYPLDKCPWLALRLIPIDNEDYGRGYVEEYLGDLKSLEGLSRAIVEGAASSAKMLWMVAPNGSTKKKTISDAPNNAVIEGKASDVTVLKAEKYNDFRVALETIKEITTRLGFAFLLNSSVQRNGERVTAEEIRLLAGELEESLGGIYSVLTLELQMPLLNREMARMQRAKKIPMLPKGIVRPIIITGSAAIGRNKKLEALKEFVADIVALEAKDWLEMDEVVKRVGVGRNLDLLGLVKSKEKYAADQQQMQMMAMAQNVAPHAVKAAGDMANTAVAAATAPQAPAPAAA